MKCSLGCVSKFPAIGVATLKGKPGTPVAGELSQYFLCDYHKQQIENKSWGNVELLGWEPLPQVDPLK